MYWYRCRYRRTNETSGKVHTAIVGASDADDARARLRVIDVHAGHTSESPRRLRRLPSEPEQADGMTAAKARDDLDRGTAHFDREFVEWRGTEVEVTG